MIDLIIKDTVIITMDGGRRVLGEKDSDAAVAIDNGRILEVGTTQEIKRNYSADREIDGRKKVVLPGLIDCHAHPFGFFATGDHEAPNRIVNLHTFIVTDVLNENNFHTQGLMASIERLRFGVTTGITMVERIDSSSYSLNFARGVQESGARGIICPSMGDSLDEYVPIFSQVADGVNHFQDSRVASMVGTGWVGGASLTAPYLAKPSKEDRKVSKEIIARLRGLMKQYRVGLHTHAGKGMIEDAYRASPEWLGDDVALAHCREITDHEISLLARTKTSVATCPYVYAIGGGEPMRLVEFLKKKINVGLGSDHGIRISFDIMKEMKTAMILQRMRFKHRWVIPPGKLLEMATIDGATALGLNKEIGSIEKGKVADLAIIDLDKPHLTPRFNIPTRLVLESTGNDVSTVIVGGKVVLEDRKLLTMDEEKVLDTAQKEAVEIIEDANCGFMLERSPGYWGSATY